MPTSIKCTRLRQISRNVSQILPNVSHKAKSLAMSARFHKLHNLDNFDNLNVVFFQLSI